MTTTVSSTDGGWSDELASLARAATGGMLFGSPLLYTMEVWAAGQRTSTTRTILVLAASFVVLVAIHRTSGFRRTRDTRLLDAVADAVESLALGLVLVAGVLFLLREIDGSTPLAIAVNKAAYQAVPFAVGAGLARYVLTGGRNGGGDDDEAGADAPPTSGRSATVADIGSSAMGAVLLGIAIAPTDEVPMIDSAVEGWWLVALAAASLLISYAIVFVAGFAGEEARRTDHGWFQHPFTETVMSYVVSLIAALALLWAFHRLGGTVHEALSHAVVLGLPMSVGAAAGRLVV